MATTTTTLGGGAAHSGLATPGSASSNSSSSLPASSSSSLPASFFNLLASFASLPSSPPASSSIVTPVSVLTNKELYYKLNNCFVNAHRNKDGAYKDLNLRVVVGSTAFNGWFEFGGKSWRTIADWKKNGRRGLCSWDAHCWLEDAEGNVYDYVFQNYLTIAEMRGAGGALNVGLVEKVSKKNCEKKKGLTYVPAPKEVQEMILNEFRSLGFF